MSASVHAGIHPTRVGLETPSLGVDLETPQARPHNFPPGCGPGDLQGMLGYHPLETCKASWDTTPWRPARHPGIPPAMHPGIHPTPPPGVGLETPQARPLNFPPGYEPGDPHPPGQTPQLPLRCGPGDLQGMLGYHPLETCKASWDTTCNASWDPPPP